MCYRWGIIAAEGDPESAGPSLPKTIAFFLLSHDAAPCLRRHLPTLLS